MEISCESCQSKFKIPDEKLPAGKAATLTCPKCKQKIVVAPAASSAPPPASTPSPASEPESGSHGFDEDHTEDYDATDKPFDFVEEEGKTALVCETDPGVKKKIMDALNSLDYHITEAESSRDALKKMRYHVYDLVIVNEEYETSDPDFNGVLIYLERLNIEVRRSIFVVLLTSRFRTLDNMMAFNKSVNMILNLSNINEIEKILRRGMTDNDYFYRIFMEGLRKAGRI